MNVFLIWGESRDNIHSAFLLLLFFCVYRVSYIFVGSNIIERYLT